MRANLLKLRGNIPAIRFEQLLKVFPVLNLILAAYLAFLWFEKPPAMPQPAAVQSSQNTAPLLQPLKQPKPFSYYAGKFQEKDIFAALNLTAQALPQAQDNAAITQNQINMWKTQWKAVGVVLDSHPEAMIETRSGETFFLHEGDELEGVRVKSIREGSVLFEWKTQEFELVQ